jgi:hypothetical protein
MITNYLFINDSGTIINHNNYEYFIIGPKCNEEVAKKLLIGGYKVIKCINNHEERLYGNEPIRTASLTHSLSSTCLNEPLEVVYSGLNSKDKFKDFNKFQNSMKKEAQKLIYEEKREQYKQHMKQVTSLSSSISKRSQTSLNSVKSIKGTTKE